MELLAAETVPESHELCPGMGSGSFVAPAASSDGESCQMSDVRCQMSASNGTAFDALSSSNLSLSLSLSLFCAHSFDQMAWVHEGRSISFPDCRRLNLPDELPATSSSQSLLLFDFDRDGHNELAFIHPTGRLFIYKDFALQASITLGPNLCCLCAGPLLAPDDWPTIVIFSEHGQVYLVRVELTADSPSSIQLVLQETIQLHVNVRVARLTRGMTASFMSLIVTRSDRVLEIFSIFPAQAVASFAGRTLALIMQYSAAYDSQIGNITATSIHHEMDILALIKANGQLISLSNSYQQDAVSVFRSVLQRSACDIAASDEGQSPLLITTTDGSCVAFDLQQMRCIWEVQVYYPIFQSAVVRHPAYPHATLEEDLFNLTLTSEPDVVTTESVATSSPDDTASTPSASSTPTTTSNAALMTSPPEWLMIACAWDGTTIIFDREQRRVQYALYDEVCAFTAGRYGQDDRTYLVHACFAEGIKLTDISNIPPLNITTWRECMDDATPESLSELPTTAFEAFRRLYT
ncbi:uncharacterized protein MONBRDRAFT_25716 [Monosiga brevicollis MX1]|uniref:Uncharacterized protein n=1 Tax=Monosiga brevicollis TaxID=81824 RepID=A9V080_MONBE|nr:uncharacterized protein MONBRDRAFT_25716 [Monosiga brevicollis MX1]EDQ89110.1 predicted protein [Monosiga brevicollis MX1]|eukprot:XP_001746215.1 hypothetical protein [Monosiga brevicollis MX1]